jgi:hypothetical protein
MTTCCPTTRDDSMGLKKICRYSWSPGDLTEYSPLSVLLPAPANFIDSDVKGIAGEASAGGTAGSGTAEMPPIGFVPTIAADELYDALKGTAASHRWMRKNPEIRSSCV